MKNKTKSAKKQKEVKAYATFPLSDDKYTDTHSGVQLPRGCQIAAAKKFVDDENKK